jgi:hypothetical protein
LASEDPLSDVSASLISALWKMARGRKPALSTQDNIAWAVFLSRMASHMNTSWKRKPKRKIAKFVGTV